MTQNEIVKDWIDLLARKQNKTNTNELTINEIKDEIEEVKYTLRNEYLWALGSSNGYHEENINNLEEYLEVLYALLVEKEVEHEIMD